MPISSRYSAIHGCYVFGSTTTHSGLLTFVFTLVVIFASGGSTDRSVPGAPRQAYGESSPGRRLCSAAEVVSGARVGTEMSTVGEPDQAPWQRSDDANLPWNLSLKLATAFGRLIPGLFAPSLVTHVRRARWGWLPSIDTMNPWLREGPA